MLGRNWCFSSFLTASSIVLRLIEKVDCHFLGATGKHKLLPKDTGSMVMAATSVSFMCLSTIKICRHKFKKDTGFYGWRPTDVLEAYFNIDRAFFFGKNERAREL